ncbi:MAG: glycosyltransferase family 2 protein [Arenicellales bacterium]
MGKKQKMTVSVIMPTYNYGKYLAEAISSVFSQSYQDLELIVVDDGSTDNTREVLAQISDPRLTKINIENSGVSVARNTGLNAASGKYIAFIDADDRWLPTKLEKQVTLFEAEPSVGLVFTNFSRFDNERVYPETLFEYVPELAEIPKRPVKTLNGYVITENTFSALASTGEMASWVQTILVRSEAVHDLRFPEGVKLCEDYHYMLRVYERVQAAYIDEPLVEVRRHGSNSYADAMQMLEPKAAVISMVLEDIESEYNRKVLNRRLGRAWSAIGYAHFWGGGALKSTRAYLKAMRYRGSTWNALKHILLLPFLPLILRLHAK